MKRSAILSLKFANDAKQSQVSALLKEYRSAVNFYIDRCWDHDGSFNAITLRLLPGSPLSYRYKSQAIKQAVGIVVGTKRAAKETGKKATKPFFQGGADLSTNMLNLSFVENSFDCWARLSTLTKGKPIWLPCRKTRVFNKWAAVGKLIAGGTLFERRGKLYLRVSFNIPVAEAVNDGPTLGIDRGVVNVLATSEGKLIGDKLDTFIDRIKRTVPKSRGRMRARISRDQYVNECLKKLPFGSFTVFVIEALKFIKHGKRGRLRRATNRRFSHWTVGAMGERLKQLCQERNVFVLEVPPAYTSQRCPACGHVERGNRRGTVFRCVSCDHTGHADLIGARNIRDVGLGIISVPHAKVQLVKI